MQLTETQNRVYLATDKSCLTLPDMKHFFFFKKNLTYPLSTAALRGHVKKNI